MSTTKQIILLRESVLKKKKDIWEKENTKRNEKWNLALGIRQTKARRLKLMNKKICSDDVGEKGS